MDAPCLGKHIDRIKNFNKMQAWRRAVDDHIKELSENHEELATTSTESSSLPRVPIREDDADDDCVDADDYCVVTTSLQQICREDANLMKMEQQLNDEQNTNH